MSDLRDVGMQERLRSWVMLPFLVSNWVDVGATEMSNSGREAGLGGVVAGVKG